MYAVDLLCYELFIHKIFRYKVKLMEEWCTENMTSEKFGDMMVQEYQNAKGIMFVLLMNFLMSLGWELMDKN